MTAQDSHSKDKSSVNEDGPDQRYLPRWEVKNRVVCRFDNEKKPIECSSKDISCTGACICLKEEVAPKQKVKLTIYLSKDTSVDVQGEIVWHKSAEGQNCAGVMFANIPETAQDLILKHAFEMKKEELIAHWYKGWNKN